MREHHVHHQLAEGRGKAEQLQEREPGETLGDFRQGTALRRIEIPGADHATIIWSDPAYAETVAWLDAAFGIQRGAAPPAHDPRGPVVALLGVLMGLVLPGFGLLLENKVEANQVTQPTTCKMQRP